MESHFEQLAVLCSYRSLSSTATKNAHRSAMHNSSPPIKPIHDEKESSTQYPVYLVNSSNTHCTHTRPIQHPYPQSDTSKSTILSIASSIKPCQSSLHLLGGDSIRMPGLFSGVRRRADGEPTGFAREWELANEWQLVGLLKRERALLREPTPSPRLR
jgi:hypothetical protein